MVKKNRTDNRCDEVEYPSVQNRDRGVKLVREKIDELNLEWSDQDTLVEVVENLLEGRDHITYGELRSLLPEDEDHTNLLKALLDTVSDMGVSITDAEPDTADTEKPTSELADLENVRADDLLSVYLAEMSREPLLTFDEEVELARQIELGHQAQEALRESDYPPDEYERLHAQIEAGQAAREHLGQANTRLVVSIAKRYRGYGIPFPDLIQDGNVGLMRAVDRYDHRSGNRFSTYATWWIRQAVTRSLANQGRVIRIPVHMGGRMREMAQVAQRLEMKYGQRPTPEEIATAMGESANKIRQMMRWASRPLSLEQPMGEEGDVELGDFVEDESIPEPEETTDAHLLTETLDELLNILTAREARILRLRYGLQDGQTRTLHQVAQKFGLSRERIRQIEREALAKLRLIAPKNQLEHFLMLN
jgi:RNA polymerase primary sigma factor